MNSNKEISKRPQLKPQKPDNVLVSDFYNVKKRDINFENDSSFSQSQYDNTTPNQQQSKVKKDGFIDTVLQEDNKKQQSQIRENKLRQEIERGIAQFQNVDLQKSLILLQDSVVHNGNDTINNNNLQQLTKNSESPMMTQQNIMLPLSTINNSQQSLGSSDVLTDYLRQTKYTKYQLKKKGLNFHSQLIGDKSLSKNQGGAGSFLTNTYSMSALLKTPQEIVREKQKQQKEVKAIEQMKINSMQANLTIDNDKLQKMHSFDKRSQNQKRDLSYRVEAVQSALHNHRQKQFQAKSGQMVESSVQNLQGILSKDERLRLLGQNKIEMPSDLNALNELINDRKLLLTELNDMTKVIPNEGSLTQDKRRTGSQGISIKPSSRVEFQIQRNHANPLYTANGKFHKTFSKNFHTQSQQRLNTGSVEQSVCSMPVIQPRLNSQSQSHFNSTFNININTSNYYLNQPQSPFSPSQSTLDLLSPSLISAQNAKDQHTSQYMTNAKNGQQPLLVIPENRSVLQLGYPQSRKDAENLQQWFEEMLRKVDQEEGMINKSKREQIKMNVYHATFIEVCRQVSVQCINRGELLKLLWNGFFRDLHQQLKKALVDKEKIESKLKDELDDQNLFYLDQLKRKNTEMDRLNQIIEDYKTNFKNKTKELSDQKIETERWKLKFEKVMQSYKDCKFKLLMAEAVRNSGKNMPKQNYKTPKNGRNESDFLQVQFQKQNSENKINEKNSDTSIVVKDLDQDSFTGSSQAQIQDGGGQQTGEDGQLQFKKNKPSKGRQFDNLSSFKRKKINHSNTLLNFHTIGMTPKNSQDKQLVQMNQIPQNDKNVGTTDDLQNIDEETQTIGAGLMLANLAAEELRKSGYSKRTSRAQVDLGQVSFEDDIDNIVAEETSKHQQIDEQDKKNIQQKQNRRESLLRKISEIQKQDQLTTNQLELLSEEEKQIHQLRGKSQTQGISNPALSGVIQITKLGGSTDNDKQDNQQVSSNTAPIDPDEININRNHVMQSFASGLKAGLLQKVIHKLKENFKSKELLIKQLIDENRDLFMQLDIEKAKFQQVARYKEEDAGLIIEMQGQFEGIKKEMERERNKSRKIKELMQEASNINDIKKKLNLSISDVDEEDDQKSKTLPKNSTLTKLGDSGNNPPLKSYETNIRIKDKQGLNNDNEDRTKTDPNMKGRTGTNRQRNQKGNLDDKTDSQTSLGQELSKQSLMNLGMDDWALDNAVDDADFILNDISDGDSDTTDFINQAGNTTKKDSIKGHGSSRKSQIPLQLKRQRNNIMQPLHASQLFLQKIIKRLYLPKFLRISCTLKQLLKTINAAYIALVNIHKQELSDFNNGFSLKRSCMEFVYDMFLRKCGIKNMAEKRFAQTISACVKYQQQILRVRIFGRFLNLFDSLDRESFKFYLIALNYITNVSTFGYLVPGNDQDECHHAPYIRVNDFIRNYFENRISTEEYQDLKLSIDKLKENDYKKNRNTYIVELDKAFEILINQHLSMLSQKRGHVQDLFSAFDYEQMEIIDFQSFYLIMIHLENNRFSYIQIKSFFDKNCEVIAINSKKDAKKYLTIESFISLCFQEKLFSKDNQQQFLQIPDWNDEEVILEKLIKFKSGFKEEIEQIKRRFYYIYLYFKDLIQLIQVMIEKASPEKLKKKAKQIWILIRFLQEESKRQYLEIHAQKYMCLLDCFTFVNSGWLLLEEQRNVFEVSFLRAGTLKQNSKMSEFSVTTVHSLKQPELVLPQSQLQIGGSAVSSMSNSRQRSARKKQ